MKRSPGRYYSIGVGWFRQPTLRPFTHARKRVKTKKYREVSRTWTHRIGFGRHVFVRLMRGRTHA